MRAPQSGLKVVERAKPLVHALRIRPNETSSFFIQTGWEVEAAITETGDHSLRYSIAEGVRLPMHCLAAGKALLATFEPAKLDRHFDETRRVRFTRTTIVGEQELERRA